MVSLLGGGEFATAGRSLLLGAAGGDCSLEVDCSESWKLALEKVLSFTGLNECKQS